MSDPAWAQGAAIAENNGGFTFADYQTVGYSNVENHDAQIQVLSQNTAETKCYVEIKCISGTNTNNGYGAGLAAISALSTNFRVNYNAAGFAWIADNGGLLIDGVVKTTLAPFVAGSVVGFLFDATGSTPQVSVYYGGSVYGPYALTTAGPYVPCISFVGTYNNPGTFSVAGSAANCVNALPSDAQYWPANAILAIASAAYNPGSPLQVVWASANAPPSAALEVILDGGAPVATGGTNTGNGGTLTCATSVSPGFHTVTLVDPGNPLSSASLTFYAPAATDGAILASTSQTFTNFGIYENTNAVTLTLDSPASEIVFELDTSVVGTYGYYFTDFAFYSTAAIAAAGPSDAGTGYIQGPTGDGTGYKPSPFGQDFGQHLPLGSLTATMTITAEGQLDYTVSTNGSTVTSSVGGPPAGGKFGAVVITPSFYADQEKFVVNAVVRAAPVPETLTLDTVGINEGGTLVVAGTVRNAILTALNLSADGVPDFAPASNLSVEGTAFTATGPVLEAGDYMVQGQDGTSGVVSNTLPLTVQPTGAPIMAMMLA